MDAETAAGTWLVEIGLETPDYGIAEAFSTLLEDFTSAQTAHETSHDIWSVRAYSADKPDIDAIRASVKVAAATLQIAEPPVHFERLLGIDWVAKVYEGLEPLQIGRFYIYGSHIKDNPPANALALKIDAATAFGTGEHGSTGGCLTALGFLVKRQRPRRVLDVGTGTGILAMAAVRAGAKSAVAVDIDPRAVAVARENVRINGMADVIRTGLADGTGNPLVGKGRPYDLVFANILAGPLVQMSRQLAAEVAPGGHIILAGLLRRQAVKVANAYRRQGLHLVTRINRDMWTTLLLRRP